MTEKNTIQTVKHIIGLLDEDNFKSIRYISLYNAKTGFQPWFAGKDVAEALGYDKPSEMYDVIDEKFKMEINPQNLKTEDYYISYDFNKNAKSIEDIGSTTFVATQFESNPNIKKMIMVNEAGLYEAIFCSKLPKAKEFKYWVLEEVLPSIHQNGFYISSKHRTEKQEAKVRMEDIISNMKRSSLIRQGVRYPEWFEALDDYKEWEDKINKDLDYICEVDGFSSRVEALRKVFSCIWDMEHISLHAACSTFCSRQIENIKYLGFRPTDEDYEIFNPDTISRMYVIYYDVKLRGIFTNYIVHGFYFVVKQMIADQKKKNKVVTW